MFRHPLVRDVAWISLIKLLALILIYVMFFTPAHRVQVNVWNHIASSR